MTRNKNPKADLALTLAALDTAIDGLLAMAEDGSGHAKDILDEIDTIMSAKFVYAWLNKNDGSFHWETEEPSGILEDKEYKYLGKLEVKP